MNTSRRALRHDVRDGIVRGILEGEFGPGDRLIEMHIAKEYGTSQGPVREALRELEMLGFVRSEPHRGTYVRDPWQRGMLELYELRGALEEFAARMATPRLKDDVRSLQAEIDAMAAAADADDAAQQRRAVPFQLGLGRSHPRRAPTGEHDACGLRPAAHGSEATRC